MEILSIRPEPPGGSGRTIARCDIALNEDVRLFGLRIVAREAGGFAVYAPNAHGKRVATFSPDIVETIASAAVAALEELTPHDRTSD